MTPLPKPGDACNPSNHRPISSLPILSKFTEKIITYQIRSYLETNSLISPKQFGFREHHSTQSLLLQLTNKWLKSLDNITGEKYICLTTLDIKKAFDSVDHELLLYKMCNLFNFHSSTTKLMANYLTSRCQYLKTNGVISTRMPVLSGVPQGSVLGPLMFIMFVNDLAHTCPCYLFADDCIIEQYGNTPIDAVTSTNELLPTVAKWYENNLLKLNTSKTYVLMLANRQIDTDQLPPVVINGNTATYTNSFKYLGLHLDTTLSWNEHIACTKNKILPVISKFARIRHLIDLQTAKLYYTSLIRPQLEYAAAVRFNMSATNINIIEILQNRCLRIVALAKPRTQTELLRRQLNIPTTQHSHNNRQLNIPTTQLNIPTTQHSHIS